jgi:predicted ATPase
LQALWSKAKRGQGQVGLIHGEAGIGKSHLCEYLLEHIVEETHAILRYQCSPHHLNSPFYPVIRQLEHAIGIEQTDSADAKLEKLETALSLAVEATQDEIQLYAALLSIATPERQPAPSETPQRRKHLTIAALSRHLVELANKRPLIVALADAHWIDSSTLELVNNIIPLIKARRVLFLITFRPEFTSQWLGEPHVTRLRLDRLGREESLAMICEVTGGRDLPQAVQQQIIDKADGIPLFVEELTKSVLESELAQDVGDRCVAASCLLFPAVPATLLDSLIARLDRLGPAKVIAQIGAVIGREFSYRLMASVIGESANWLPEALAQLAFSELISVSGELPDATYTFRHALVRDAAYATLSRERRQQLDNRVADALESDFPFTIETQPELLAHHLAQAGLAERAIHYLKQAGQRAIERSANAAAIVHLTRALELLQSLADSPLRKRAKLSLQVMLSQAIIVSYGYAAPRTQETIARAKALLDESTDRSQRFSILYGVWASHCVSGEVAKQAAAAAEFFAEAKRTDDAAIWCIAYRLVGTTHVTLGEFATGLHHLKQARALHDPDHHAGYRHQYGQDIGASTLCYLSWAQWHLGYLDEASETATEAMRLAERLSHPHTLVYTICHARCFMDLFRCRYENMEAYANAVVSICSENGFLHWANFGKILRGYVAVNRGQVDRGIELLRQGIVGWQSGGAGLWIPIFLTLEAQACANAGRNEAALRAIEQALATSPENGVHWATAEVLRTKARVLLSMGRANNRETTYDSPIGLGHVARDVSPGQP